MTTEIKIYVANLGKYNEGELVGAWFTLPTDMDEIKEEIGVGDGTDYEEWAIHDYEAPFKINEYDSIDALNEIAELMESMDETDVKIAFALLDNGIVSDFESASQIVEDGDVITYHENSMSDIAYSYYENNGLMDSSNHLMRYVDWDAVGRDMEIEGTFIEVDNGLWVEVLN